MSGQRNNSTSGPSGAIHRRAVAVSARHATLPSPAKRRQPYTWIVRGRGCVLFVAALPRRRPFMQISLRRHACTPGYDLRPYVLLLGTSDPSF